MIPNTVSARTRPRTAPARPAPAPGGGPPPGPGAVRRGLAFGLAVGGLELALVLALRALDPTVSMAMLRTNRHALWMLPAADLGLFAALGLALAAFGAAWPRPARWLAWRLETGLGALALLLEFEGLMPAAAVVLAAGVGVRLGPGVGAVAGRLGRRAAPAFWAAGVGLAALAVAGFLAVTTAERRALAALPAARPGAPNVVLVVLDNVRASSLSLLGRDRPTTPNLARLAKEGVLFTRARSTSSWTLPGHASLFTGRWCHELSFDFDRPLDAAFPTLAEALAGEGYATAGFVGNTYYGNALYGLGRGFARYEDHYENLAVTPFEVVRAAALGKRLLHALGYPIRVDERASVRKTAAMVNRDALGWLDRRPAGRPFFLFLNYFDAHAPFLPDAGPDPLFGLAALPLERRGELLMREQRLARGKLKATGEEAARIVREAAAVRLDSYESCIAALDRQVGLLFDALDRRGLRENTLIVLTSDHGEHFAERGFYGHGNSLYEPEVHVPLVIFPPRGTGPAGRVVDERVSLRDTAATVVDLLGLADRRPFPGASLARFWHPGAAGAGSPFLSELGHRKNLAPSRSLPASLGPLQSLVVDDHLYIHNGDGTEELYDLRHDPDERHDLAPLPAHRPALESCRRALDRLLRGAEDGPRAG